MEIGLCGSHFYSYFIWLGQIWNWALFAKKYQKGITPSKYAVHLKTITVEKEVDQLPPQHPKETRN